MVDILQVVGNFRQNIKKLCIHADAIVCLQIRTLQDGFFIQNIARESCIEVTILVFGCCQAFSS